MDSPYRITVYGTPAPQGSKRHVGKGIMVESSKRVKPWRQDVKHAALDVRDGAPPLEDALSVHIAFTLHRPAAAKKRLWPFKKPDLDKLIRSTLDGLGESGIWVDDAQVVTIVAAKLYVGFPGALDAPGALIDIGEPIATGNFHNPSQEGLFA